MRKAQAAMDKSDVKIRATEAVKKALLGKIKLKSTGSGSTHTAEEAAEKFIQVLESTIASSGLTDGAKQAVSGWTHSTPYVSGDSVCIDIYHEGNEYRPSLYQSQQRGVDIIELFDAGANSGAKMNRVFGEWHGKMVGSRTVIPGAGFIQEAVDFFNGSYAVEYSVTDIIVNRNMSPRNSRWG